MNNLLIITGPTASGKTALGIEIAKRFNGEIVSADSRQVYRGMDIGTGKDKEDYENAGVKVWCLDLVDPDYHFNVSDYLHFSGEAIADIQGRGKMPIIVGGAILYIKALLWPFETINVPPDMTLRKKLQVKSRKELRTLLQKKDLQKWTQMNVSDRNNPRRLIRAIEVASSLSSRSNSPHPLNPTIIALTAPLDFLYERIDRRVEQRIEEGAIKEIETLVNRGYHFNLPSFTATGYKEFRNHFQNPTEGELVLAVQRWKYREHAYARRQLTFLRKFLRESHQKGVKVCSYDVQSISQGKFSERVMQDIP